MIEPTTEACASGFALRLVGTSEGRRTSLDGAYVVTYDPDAHEGAGRLRVTRQLTKARHSGNPVSAQQYYEQQSVARPLGRDGKPNHPLTRYNVKVVWVGLPEHAGMSDYTCYFVGAALDRGQRNDRSGRRRERGTQEPRALPGARYRRLRLRGMAA